MLCSSRHHRAQKINLLRMALECKVLVGQNLLARRPIRFSPWRVALRHPNGLLAPEKEVAAL